MYNNPYDLTNPIWNAQAILGQNQLLQRVGSVSEVESDPIRSLNSEKVYLNTSDETILYIRRIDSNGKSSVKRYRYYEDPEPTQQELNDQRYITVDEFTKFKTDLVEMIKQNGKGKFSNGNRPNKENV